MVPIPRRASSLHKKVCTVLVLKKEKEDGDRTKQTY